MNSPCQQLTPSPAVNFTAGDLAAMPFQNEGIAAALEMRRCFITDEPGLGKTIQALGAIELSGSYPAVVVCKARLKTNWRREVERWLPGRTVEVMDGLIGPEPTADVVVVNYDIIQKRWRQLAHRRALIVDESHCCKSEGALRTRGVLALAGTIPDDGLVLLLSGTPLLNQTHELIPQIEIISRLREFGGAAAFEQQYCRRITFERMTRYGLKTITKWIGGKNLDELNRRMQPYVIRRLKSEVLPELPPKRDAELWLDIDQETLREYNALIKENTIGSTSQAWQALGLAKAEAAAEWIREFLLSGKQLVVFVHHRAVGQYLVEEFNCPAIRGGMSLAESQEAIDQFQEAGADVIVCSLQAAAEGVTLTAASDVLFVEQPWTPATLDQAGDRCHRIGQRDSVTVWIALVPGTLDVKVRKLLRSKRVVTAAVLR